jgi:hypothetical protein
VDITAIEDLVISDIAAAPHAPPSAASATPAFAESAPLSAATGAAILEAPADPVLSRADWIEEELKEWRKATVPTLRSFATTMLTTSSGGVAVYFAVLKYLGWEKAQFGTALVALTLAPPVLLFAAAVTFALVLRPSLSMVEKADYAEFRARRVAQMHRRATLGFFFYAGAILIAGITFVFVLEIVP